MQTNITRIFFLIIIWASFFSSININPLDFYNISFVQKLRILAPLILIIIYFFFEFKNLKVSNFANFYQIFFLIIFFLYFYFNITFSGNLIGNTFWPIYMFLSFFFLISLNENSEVEILFKFTFIIIGVGLIFYLSAAILEMIHRKNLFFYGIGLTYLGIDHPPRSSGLSRLSLVSFWFLITYYFINKKKDNYIFLTLITLTGFFTLVFQSRTMSMIFYSLLFINIIFNFKNFFYDKKLILFSLIIPVILSFSYIYIATKDRLYVKELDNPLMFIVKDSLIRDQYSSVRNKETKFDKKMDRFSSHRFENWKKAKNIIQKNYFKGYGAQSDRILINQSIHNAVIYSTLSGGIISGISIIFIYLFSVYYFIKIYFLKNYPTLKEFEVKLSLNILILFNLRSLLESSFAVYSIDYLVYIISFIYLNHLLKKNHSL